MGSLAYARGSEWRGSEMARSVSVTRLLATVNGRS